MNTVVDKALTEAKSPQYLPQLGYVRRPSVVGLALP
jgi:hypothetical protein